MLFPQFIFVRCDVDGFPDAASRGIGVSDVSQSLGSRSVFSCGIPPPLPNPCTHRPGDVENIPINFMVPGKK